MQTRSSYALAVAVLMAVGALLTACSFVVEVDGTAHSIRVLLPTVAASATPPGSDTPTPTRTPTATATATPSATVTPTPAATDTPLYGTDAPPPDTLTPAPSATPTDVFPTPTPDTLPSVTPGPSATPVPPPDSELCFVASNYNMRIRSGPGTQYPQVGLLPSETRAVVVSLWIQEPEGSAQREEWAQLDEGRWLAVWINGDQLAFLDDAAPCWELPRDGPGSVPQPVLFGFHHIPGEGGSADVPYAQQVSACKDVNTGVCQQIEAINPNVVTVYRSLHTRYGMVDCPEPWMYGSPSIWIDALQLQPGYDFYEVQNECGPPPGMNGWRDWAQWSIALAQHIEAEYGGRLLAFSFAAGNPDLEHWQDLAPYIEWVDAHGRATGIWHGIALHQAVYAPWFRADMPWVNNSWIAGRHMMIRREILDATGIDLAGWRGVVAVTEGGLSDGYSGNWTAPYSCDEAASAAAYTVERHTIEGVVDVWAWWNLGKIGQWTSDHACVGQMLAQRVQ